MSEELQTEMNRRAFLAAATALGCCAMGCTSAFGADDDDEDEDVPKVPLGPVDAGPVSDFAKDGSYDKWVKSRHFILFREQGKIYATTAICTHKQALLKVVDDHVYCPRHKSVFDFQGQPAPKPNGKIGQAKKPLNRFAISIDEKKHVIVDTSKPIAADHADAPGSFVNG